MGWTVVQSNVLSTTTSVATSTKSGTATTGFTNPTTPGNYVFVIAGYAANLTTTGITVSDTGGNTWVNTSVTQGSTGQTPAIFSGAFWGSLTTASISGASAITVSFPATNTVTSAANIVIIEANVTGGGTITDFQDTPATGTGTAVAAGTGPAGFEVLNIGWGGYTVTGGGAASTWTPGGTTGWTGTAADTTGTNTNGILIVSWDANAATSSGTLGTSESWTFISDQRRGFKGEFVTAQQKTTATTIAATAPTTTAAGDVLVAMFTWLGGTGTFSVADTSSNTWTTPHTVSNGTTITTGYAYCVAPATGATPTVTVTGPSTTARAMYLAELHRFATTPTFDARGTDQSGTSTTWLAPTATSQAVDAYWLGVSGFNTAAGDAITFTESGVVPTGSNHLLSGSGTGTTGGSNTSNVSISGACVARANGAGVGTVTMTDTSSRAYAATGFTLSDGALPGIPQLEAPRSTIALQAVGQAANR